MNWTIVLLNGFELMAAITGFVVYPKLLNRYYRFFPWYLLAIFLTEVIAEYIAWGYNNPALNNAIYRYWGIPLQFFFFFWLFYQTFNEKKMKHWPLVAALIYSVILLADLISLRDMPLRFTILSYCTGGILLLSVIISYFILLMKSDQLLKFRQSFMFWVSLGLLLFYLLTLPYFGLRNILYKNHRALFDIYGYFMLILNYLMYGCFITAFLCVKKN